MIERNQPCPCGSGRKYKKCCGAGAGSAKAPGAPPAARRSNANAAGRPQADGAGSSEAASSAPSAGNAAPTAGSTEPTDARSGLATVEAGGSGEPDKPFLTTSGRGLDSERSEAERKKHLRRRIQTRELRGTLVYNSGAFFKPPHS